MNTMSTGRTPGAPGFFGNGPTRKKKGINPTKIKQVCHETAAYEQKNMKKTIFLMIPRTKQEKTSNPKHHPKLIFHQQKKFQSIR